ncbi:MAG: hypothetical protein F6J90_03040 [Moorea sp. SIOASIH]|uniref:hypothetical protein n=1 Tax=Moorena sp. SIOASIH TaxID=2607817 RepID=UPI0013B965CF|nr:hypothetical protein [Moorena sp. SIOASIH]NEO35334.1 hypothetical protein [Moorena sp. SIOASIH]
MLISDLNHLESVDASQVQGASAGISFNNDIVTNLSTTSTVTETDIFSVDITANVDISGISASSSSQGEGSSASGFNVGTKQQSVAVTIEGPDGTASKSVGITTSAIFPY